MYDGIIYTIDGRTCHQRETLRVVQENNLSVDMVKKISTCAVRFFKIKEILGAQI